MKILLEGASFTGVSAIAFVITTQEIAIAITILLALVGAIVWLVRLEGRINTQTALLVELGHRMDRISSRLDKAE